MTKASAAQPGVYMAIAAAMEEIGLVGIAKDRRNQQQGYNFRGIDDVYNALAPILARNKLIIVPRVLSRDKTERVSIKDDGRGSSRESVLFYVVVQVEFQIIFAPDGSSVTAVTWGEAMDSADKATNKAMSAAYKYMAMQTFCIPTEGDNDADASSPQVVAPAREPAPQRAPAPETASKADARADFAAMQHEIRNVRSANELREWGKINKTRKERMPPDWQKQLTDEYRDMMRGYQAAAAPATEIHYEEIPI